MNKITGFLKNVYGELIKVVWLSKADTIRYTLTVIIFSVVTAVILGAADLGLLTLFEKILNK